MEIIPYTTEADWLQSRSKDITSTEISCLFGCNPYMTAYELWHRKKSGIIPEFQTTERTEWGLALQDAIASRIAIQQGWNIRRMDEYIRDPELQIGSSFDFEITEAERIDPRYTADHGLLEIKNVDSLAFRNGWLVDGDTIEAPPHIELQVQHQLAVSGRKYAWIGALVGGNTMKLMYREPMPEIIAALKFKAAEFWAAIDNNIEPAPVFPQDTEAVIRMAQYAEQGKVIPGTDELAAMAAEYRDLKQGIKALDEQADALKAQILLTIGDAEKVKGDNYSISAGITGEADISFHRNSFRNFRVSWRKEK